MIVAYADPPYPNKAHMYGVAESIDHGLFLIHLQKTFPDGWAYSIDSAHLKDVLPMCDGARIGAWVKPWSVFKPKVNPSYSWEAVIFKPARKAQRGRPTVRDFVIASAVTRGPCKGRKPDDFCYWLFDLLQLEEGDEFVDLFEGSGNVRRCWERWVQWAPRGKR